MDHPSIDLQGNILSAELLEELEREAAFQTPASFGLASGRRVKDEIATAWGEALAEWKVFVSKKARVREGDSGVSETRQFWMAPLLDTLGHRLTVQRSGEEVGGANYFISHREEGLGGFPVHIVGFGDSLDRRRVTGRRLSPHALVQEYLNVTEHLYAILTNGYRLRLLRDSSRLTRLSYIEFDLVRMMEEEIYPDFAVLFRLLHRSRMPQSPERAAESVIEFYHQLGIEQGARIREGLSRAVRDGIEAIANGILAEPGNVDIRRALAEGRLTPQGFYGELLRLIYRLLFLFVLEERDLVFPGRGGDGAAGSNGRTAPRDLYRQFYGIGRLRRLAERAQLVDGRQGDLWMGLKHTFRLFEDPLLGGKLGIPALAGELFGAEALRWVSATRLKNAVLLHCLGLLTRFRSKQGEWVRVSYAALNVEEFGSVYEGLLELEPRVEQGESAEEASGWGFRFVGGDERSKTGSHYTPDELVRPLVEHALDPVIRRKLEPVVRDAAKAEEVLLSLKVCDVACGSGHFLLAASRRIAQKLASVRTGEEQPNPAALRRATRDVIGHCIYGVDKNPMAVELCKVALWLEAHNPGMPLTFLDHRIKCGDAIVGVARVEELREEIPDEAFKALDGEDKGIASLLRKRNAAERKARGEGLQLVLGDEPSLDLASLAAPFRAFEAMPDDTPEARRRKEEVFAGLTGETWWRLNQLANVRTAQFFLPKTTANRDLLCTDGAYRRLQVQPGRLTAPVVHRATAEALKRRFFNWFLEYPEVMARGGFDCILGNPPFLGGLRITSNFGQAYLNWLKSAFEPAGGTCDLVGYFFRRDFSLLRGGGAMGLIATNTIAQGDTREAALAVIEKQGGTINFAIRSMKWPGVAALEVALMTIQKGPWNGERVLDRRPVSVINSYLSDETPLGDPFPLAENSGKSFIGSYVLGMGFVMRPEEARALIERDPRNAEVLFPYLNGEDLNSRPDQSPSRWVINFFDWPEERARTYPDVFRIVEDKVKPERDRLWAGDSTARDRARRWWQFARPTLKLYRTIAQLETVLVHTRVTRTHGFAFVDKLRVFSETTVVFAFEDDTSFGILQSSLHEYWAWKYSSSLKSDRRYGASDCFETFPFPTSAGDRIGRVGTAYETCRRDLMRSLGLGLTKVYNLFHTPDLTVEGMVRLTKRDAEVCRSALSDIERLRGLQVEMDRAVLAAYGWSDLDPGHDFHAVDFLPENDRVRFTIHPEARREVLRRLLLLNHERKKGEG